MRLDLNFGRLEPRTGALPEATDRFRIVLLGDFSGRAARGGDAADDEAPAIGRRRAIRVDVDELDAEIERLGIELVLDVGGGTVRVPITSMDSFHPDEILEEVEVFEELLGLRRRLDSGRWESAAQEIAGWPVDGEPGGAPAPRSRSAARDDTAVPVGGRLGDFAALLGGPVGTARAETDVDELVRAIVGPHVVDARDPRQDELLTRVDEAIAGALRGILHHPHFRAVESSWRTVEWLVRNLETGPSLSITLHDLTAAELAADLAAHDELAETGLHRLLVEDPSTDASLGAPGLIAGLFVFEQTPPHAELLGRMARLAAAAGAPFVAGLGREVIRRFDPDRLPPLIVESWRALRAMPEAAYLGLTTPRFLLRAPYGVRSDPVDAFDFEEFTRRDGLRTMLWGNGAALVARLLGANVTRNGLRGLNPDAVLSVGDMPFHWFTDDHGDQVALPCTEQLLSERTSTWITGQGVMPVLAVRGRPEVRLGGIRSVAGGPLAGPWAPAAVAAPVASTAIATDDDDDAAESTAVAESPAEDEPVELDDELAALLADLDGGGDDEATAASSNEPTSGDDEDDDGIDMDPELAALLADL